MNGNAIPVRQNEPDVVALLAAAHGLYERARALSRTQFWLGAIAPAAFAFAGLQSRLWLEIGAMYAVAMLLADEALEAWIDYDRIKAATAQQMFDCTLFGWTLRGGTRRLDASDVEMWAKRGSAHGLPLNWYPDNITAAPLSLACVICQRANMWWDAKLRVGYVALMTVVAVGISAIVMAAAWRLDWTIGVTALAMVNVLPVVQWCVRHAIRHSTTHNSTKQQSERALAIQQGLIERRLTEEEAQAQSRALQEDIYERRRTSPIGVSWIYKKSRTAFDRGMKANAAQVIKEFFEAER